MDQTVDRADLLRDLYDLMCCLFKSKCFTFVVVERDLPLTRHFDPKIWVTTEGITCRSNGFEPFVLHMTEQRVWPASVYDTNRLTTCCHHELIIFKFDQDYEYDYGYDNTCGLDLWTVWGELPAGGRVDQKEWLKTYLAESWRWERNCGAPKRALAARYKECAKKQLAWKNPDTRRKKQEPHKIGCDDKQNEANWLHSVCCIYSWERPKASRWKDLYALSSG